MRATERVSLLLWRLYRRGMTIALGMAVRAGLYHCGSREPCLWVPLGGDDDTFECSRSWHCLHPDERNGAHCSVPCDGDKDGKWCDFDHAADEEFPCMSS